MKFFNKCPLLLLVLTGGIAFSVIGFVNRGGIYRDYEEKARTKPAMASVFWGIKDGIYPWDTEEVLATVLPQDGPELSDGTDLEDAEIADSGAAAADDGLAGGSISGNDGAGNDGSGNDISGNGISGNDISGNGISGNDSFGSLIPGSGDTNNVQTGNENGQAGAEGDWEDPSESRVEEKTYEFTRVEEDYFSDALFIGDSRTQGMLEYSSIQDKATFYCKTSLTVYDLFKKPKRFIQAGDEKLTLEEALMKNSFGKIYLMIGINEMGTGTKESFFEEYARVVYKIRQLQPDAILYLQSIMRVAEQKNATDPIFNNERINVRNVMIQTLADNQNIFYVDVNEAVCDENGNLHSDWTFDQIHLKAKYYQVWKEYLLEHGIVKG